MSIWSGQSRAVPHPAWGHKVGSLLFHQTSQEAVVVGEVSTLQAPASQAVWISGADLQIKWPEAFALFADIWQLLSF